MSINNEINDDIKTCITIQQSTGLKRNTIDKYYTKSNIVSICIDNIKKYIDIKKNDLIIEPSAGDGSFINDIKKLTNNYKFYDIYPEHKEIETMDFLKVNTALLKDNIYKIHIIGNPPFGRQSSLAIKFIKKCCSFANTIAFILPKSFKKDSMKKYFPINFHLLNEIDLDKNAFIVNGKDCDVPCIFQIWQCRDINRENSLKLEPLHFKFVKKNEDPDISVRRVGVYAGKIMKDFKDNSIQSHYFIKFTNKKSVDDNINKLNKLIFNFNNTVGPKSISKQELIKEYNKLLID
jgi:hypothetical protein